MSKSLLIQEPLTIHFHLLFSDPYVKVWLQFGDKRIEKRKTPIFKCTLNPHFNDSFSFNVPWEKIRECSLDVMVMDFDNIGRNELIGRILLAGELIFIDLSPLFGSNSREFNCVTSDCIIFRALPLRWA